MQIGNWWESQKERDQEEDQDIGGWILEGQDGQDGQDRDRWRALVKTVLNLRVP
jgi:hypothetical protein